MSRNYVVISAALFPLLFVGCATQTYLTQPLPTSKTFAAGKEPVWNQVVAAVGMQYPVRAIDKGSGLLTTDFVSLPVGFNNAQMRAYVIPPRSLLGTWNGLRMNMSVLVTEVEAGKTQVNIRTHYEAFEDNVSKSWIVCQSNGILENGILRHIGQELENTGAVKTP
jgi:hypothetical protein